MLSTFFKTSQCGPNGPHDNPPPRRRHQYVGHWPNWPSSAAVAHGRQHRFAAGPSVRKDQYALATDEQTNKLKNKQTDKQKDVCKLYGEC